MVQSEQSALVARRPSEPADSTAAATRLLLALAKALHRYGTPAHRLEEAFARVAEAMGLRSAQLLSTPTAMHMALGEGAEQRVYLLRTTSERIDLEGLTELDAIVEGLTRGQLGVPEAEARLAALHDREPRYGARAMRWATAAASATAVVFLDGGAIELAAAAALGLGVGWLAKWSALLPRARAVHEPLAALVVSALVTLLVAAVPGVSAGVVLVAALIMMVPGLTLTTGMTELAAGHLVSGTARLAGAMTLLLTMLFGAALGRLLAGTVPLHPVLAGGSVGLPEGMGLAAIAAATVAFTVLLGARPRDAGWVALACGLSYGAARLGSHSLGPELGAFVGAATVGAASNAFARWRRRPAALMRLPGLLLLVPGSLGFRSLDSLLAADTVAGTDGMFRVAMIAIALAAGTFGADLLLPARRGL